MEYKIGSYDVAVIGAGHAGIEAGLAAARLNAKTVVFTINMDAVGNCPCNPSIGGTAKGHLVKELDALGGEMGKTADECFLQSRMLNQGKGPAVHSLRVQIDRNKYSVIMKHKLELQKNLELKQAEIIEIRKFGENWQLKTRLGAIYTVKCVVLATGTFLGGKVFVGQTSFSSGPDGVFPAAFLGEALRKIGIKTRRFKTGTPARVLKSSIDFEKLEEQPGDKKIIPFSFSNEEIGVNQIMCHIGWTNENTKKIIMENIKYSPLYSGQIEGTGPRYCPSIEDKMVRFSEKERHQLFVEPCGMDTEEMYIQGMSSSLPEFVQQEFYRSIKGLENAVIMRPAYAIEYDCIDPLQLNSSLEFIEFSGLFGAGQFNGSSGYEEAAAQGLVAGINAALKTQHKPFLILDRASSYIGTLIDDLVTKGVSDPYRMMTSRSEYRLILRQDNAQERLLPKGREIGLINDKIWEKFLNLQEQKKQELLRLEKTIIKPNSQINKILEEKQTAPLKDVIKLVDLLRRPQINYEDLETIDINFDYSCLNERLKEKIEVELKYEGYIKKQIAQIAQMRRLEVQQIPQDIDFKTITGLRLEAIEKLNKIKPENIGQASRIAGVNPADINVLMIYLAKLRVKTKEKNNENN